MDEKRKKEIERSMKRWDDPIDTYDLRLKIQGHYLKTISFQIAMVAMLLLIIILKMRGN